MRLWSIHPRYLDSKGLVALWREALLAQKVLEGKTKGYKNHPQLIRFKEKKASLECIGTYLKHIFLEARERGYFFDETKIRKELAPDSKVKIVLSTGQKKYEFEHLKKKMRIRDRKKYLEIYKIKKIEVHALFREIPGKIAKWEVL